MFPLQVQGAKSCPLLLLQPSKAGYGLDLSDQRQSYLKYLFLSIDPAEKDLQFTFLLLQRLESDAVSDLPPGICSHIRLKKLKARRKMYTVSTSESLINRWSGCLIVSSSTQFLRVSYVETLRFVLSFFVDAFFGSVQTNLAPDSRS
ncbi:hypothetical protein J6590_051456 [Homalodisca vitripennis]|nr:hypothetical protein J6590_051456 [Homalodisca vitripennis]